METFLGVDVVADVRRILNDAVATYKWSEATVVANINTAIRAVLRDSPAACYSSPVAFKESITLVGTGTEGALAGTDAIAIDRRWRDAVTHYTAYLCLNQLDRNTVNATYSDRELKLYGEAL